MKFKKLTIHNIASIEDAVIDFENGPLGEDSRFLICGPTGAGKTTILDAICLALYGTTPRLNIKKVEGYVDQFENFKLSKDRTDIKIDDTRMLMRRGSLSAFVELIFTDKDDVELKAVWRCSRAHNKMEGNIKDPDWNLFDAKTDTLLCAKKSETLKEISSRIGLSFEQFCRTTMLAQGDFTKFLKSDEGEKSQILEKLTGTDIYSDISMKIHSIKSEKEAFCQLIASKMEGVQLLSESEKITIQDQLKELHAQIEKTTKEQEIANNNYLWYTKLQEYIKVLDEYKKLLDSEFQNQSSDTFKDEESMLVDLQNTQEQRDLWKNRQQASKNVSEQKVALQSLQHEYNRLCSGLNGLRDKLKEKYRIQDRIKAYLETEASKENCYKQITLIESLVRQLTDFTTQFTNLKLSVDKRLKQVVELEKQLSEQNDIVNKNEQQKHEISRKIEEQKQQIQSLNYEKLLGQRESKDEGLVQLKEFKQCLEQLLKLDEDCNIKGKTLSEIDASINYILKEVATDEQKVKDLAMRLEQQQQVYNKQQRACDDLMKEYRSTLQVGDTCPLCGQPIHTLTTDDQFNSILQPLKELLDSLQKELVQASQAVSANKAKLAVYQKDRLTKQKDLDDNNQQKTELQKRMQAHSLFQTYPLEVGSLEHINQAIKQGGEDLARLTEQLKEIGRHQHQLNQLLKDKDQLEKQSNQTDKTVSQLDKQLTVTNETIQTEQASMVKLQQSIHEKESELADYLDIEVYRLNGATYIAELKLGAERYQIANQKAESVAVHIQEVENELKLVTQVKDKIAEEQSDWKRTEPTESINIEQLSTCWLDFQGHVSRTMQALQMSQQLYQAADQSLRSYFVQDEAVTEQRMQQLVLLNVSDIEALRKKHQQARDYMVKLKTQHETAEQNLKLHQEHRPAFDEAVTLESLSALLQATKDDLNAHNQLLGMLTQRLDNDEKNLKHYASIKKQLDKATEESNRWAHLHKLFGSSDGKKFRNIAQSYVLEQLLVNANQYLCRFTDRYEMECQPGSLTILLRDKEAGGVVRPTTTISGGESFLISLSLALGLSSLSRTSLSMDTLFIDEGFGTLDSTYLSSVMDALERLHQIGGKKIGIISHVESLKERLTTQIQVTRVNSTLSQVKVVSLI